MESSPSKKQPEELKDPSQQPPKNSIKKLSRIQNFRHKKGALIGANKIQDQEAIDTIFNSDLSLLRHISLSLYTRPKSLLEKNCLNKGNNQNNGILTMKHQPNEVNVTVQTYQSNHSEQRTKQINEIGALKSRLIREDVNSSKHYNINILSIPSFCIILLLLFTHIAISTIQKAILFPEDNTEMKRTYPKIEDMLLKNPFAKAKGKKKKGKKKKK